MTLKEADALFVELDKRSPYGDPEDFNFEAMTAAVNLLVSRMESLFNCRLRVHGPMENQDSGCFSEICIPRKTSLLRDFLEEDVSMYLSRFGNLATIPMQSSINPTIIESLRKLCAETGWNYVDVNLLRVECCHDSASGAPVTWGERFFGHY